MARTRKRRRTPTGEFDPSRWAHASFAIGAFLAAWMFSHLVEDIWAVVWSQWPQVVGRPKPYMANAIGSTIGIVGVIWAWRKEKYFKFVSEVAVEVSQVVWPTRAETRAATVVVIVITMICSVILFGMDTTWSKATDYLYNL